MARVRYIQINGKLVEVGKVVRSADPVAPYVMPDIQPYQSQITGEMIQSRSRHREHLRQHNCIEVGNEKMSNAPPREALPPAETLRREIARRFGD
jgi:hypothetical protein